MGGRVVTTIAVEEFRTIEAAPQYEIGNRGTVRHKKSGRIRQAFQHRSGHLYIRVRTGATPMRRRSLAVHRLVLIAFRGLPPLGFEARHLNGSPTDNRLENLVWGTRSENIEDFFKMAGRTSSALLRREEAERIRAEYQARTAHYRGEISEIARRYGLKVSMMHRLLRGDTYRWPPAS